MPAQKTAKKTTKRTTGSQNLKPLQPRTDQAKLLYDDPHYNASNDKELKQVHRFLTREFKKHGVSSEEMIGRIVRRSIDKVLDGPNRQRWHYMDLSDKPEKTFIGTYIEVLIRQALDLTQGDNFKLPQGRVKTDFVIEVQKGIFVCVDMKTSKNPFGWQFPKIAVASDHICIVLHFNDYPIQGSCKGSNKKHQRKFSMGLIRARREYMNSSTNGDGKRSIAAQQRDNVLWLVQDAELPMNVLQQMEHQRPEQFALLTDSAENLDARLGALMNFVHKQQLVFHRDLFETIDVPLEIALDYIATQKAIGCNILCGSYPEQADHAMTTHGILIGRGEYFAA